jgi:hypothetical protein
MPRTTAGSSGAFARTSTELGVRWKTYSSSAARARCGTHCTAVAPVPMIGDALVAEPVQRCAVRVAAV